MFPGYMYKLTSAIVNSRNLTTVSGANNDMLQTLTKPFTELVIQVG